MSFLLSLFKELQGICGEVEQGNFPIKGKIRENLFNQVITFIMPYPVPGTLRPPVSGSCAKF